MKLFKNKLFVSLISIVSVVVLVLGITFSYIDFSSKSYNNGQISIAKDQPDDTSKYWDESDEIKAIIDSGKKEDYWKGSGTETDPYLIETDLDLAWLSYMVYSGNGKVTSTNYYYQNVYFKQINDLDVSAYWWQPIGCYYLCETTTSNTHYFSGNYNGGDHTVSGVFTKSGSTDGYSYHGLFGYVNSNYQYRSTIKNVNIVKSYIQGYRYNGNIAGYVGYNCSIENCNNLCKIEGNSYIGGIVGRAGNGNVGTEIKLIDCCNMAEVIGDSNSIGGLFGGVGQWVEITSCCNLGLIRGASKLGGILGNAPSGHVTIKKCINKGNVSVISSSTTTYGFGGIGGYLYEQSVKVFDCYNTGEIIGDNYTGGVAGYIDLNNIIANCYNLGSVNGESYVGGINGRNGQSNIYNCYNVGSVSGTGGNIGGIVGLNYSNKANCYKCYYGGNCTLSRGDGYERETKKIVDLNTTTYSKNKDWFTNSSNWNASYPWDFDTVWTIVPGINDGYPIFKGSIQLVDFDTQNLIFGDDGLYPSNGTVGGTFTQSDTYVNSNGEICQDFTCSAGGTGFFYPLNRLTAGTGYKWSVDLKSSRNTALSGLGHEQGGQKTSVTITTSWQTFTQEFTANDGPYNAFTFYGDHQAGETFYVKNLTLQKADELSSNNAIPSRKVFKGSTYGDLPTPARTGYDLLGWYTGKNGTGTQITSASNVTSNTRQTLYSNWKSSDSVSPVIHRSTYVTREDGYDVYVYVTDNIGVNRVQFPTWTEYNGQDDIQQNWETSSTASGTKGTYTIDGQTYNYKYAVNMSDHNNEIGCYHTHIYAYDDAGNWINTIEYHGSEDIYFARLWTDFAATSFAGGSGTQSDPYQIATPEQLALLAKQSKTDSLTGKYFKQTAPIDLENKATKNSQYVWYVWDGIGNNAHLFAGNFDGDFNAIRNTYMNLTSNTDSSAVGLFNRTGISNISKVYMIGGNINSIVESDVGAIVGCAETSTNDKKTYISNCIVENVTIKGLSSTGYSMGGIAGSWVGEIRDCIVKDCVIDGSFACGVIGFNYYDTCVVNCSVINTTVIGTGTTGIIARLNENIESSYGCGTVNGTESKLMYGNSSAWGDWLCLGNSTINNGYPIQKALCWFADVAPSDSARVYSYLKSALRFTEVV